MSHCVGRDFFGRKLHLFSVLNARTFWAGLLVASIIAFAVDRAGGVMGTALLQRSGFRLAQALTGRVQAEVWISGNSRAMQSFASPVLADVGKTTVFNLGFNGLSLDSSILLLREALDKSSKPSVVIYELSTLLHHEGGENETDIKSLMLLDSGVAAYLRQTRPKEYYAGRVSRLYLCNSEVFFRALNYLSSNDQGYVSNRVIPEALRVVDDSHWLPDPGFNQRALAGIKELQQICAAKKIELKLVIAPYHPGLGKIWNQQAIVLKSIERDCGQPIWNFGSVRFDQNAFADRIHLNGSGTGAFADILSQSGCLKAGLVQPPPEFRL